MTRWDLYSMILDVARAGETPPPGTIHFLVSVYQKSCDKRVRENLQYCKKSSGFTWESFAPEYFHLERDDVQWALNRKWLLPSNDVNGFLRFGNI